MRTLAPFGANPYLPHVVVYVVVYVGCMENVWRAFRGCLGVYMVVYMVVYTCIRGAHRCIYGNRGVYKG
jgi:hypothetical protein